MPDHLRVTWKTDGDGTGQVTAKAAALGWAGISDGWSSDATVRSFASDLKQFPFDAEDPPHLLTGFSPDGRGEGGFHATIDIFLTVIGSRGQLGADIYLSTFVWPDDPVQVASSVRMVLPTSYQQVAEFADAVEGLLDGSCGEATLFGKTFA